MSLSVVNRHHFRGQHPEHGTYVYIGRSDRIAKEELDRGCLDGTAFGNPFRIATVPMEEILMNYKRWLWCRIKDERRLGVDPGRYVMMTP